MFIWKNIFIDRANLGELDPEDDFSFIVTNSETCQNNTDETSINDILNCSCIIFRNFIPDVSKISFYE